MSHLICLLARAGAFATRWDGAWLAEALNDGKEDRTMTRLPSLDGKEVRTVTPLPSLDGKKDRTVTPLPSLDGKEVRTVTPSPSFDGKTDRTGTPSPSFYRIFERLGAVLASETSFWHLLTPNRPENHARAPI